MWNALAKGIKSVDKNHLMTMHPWGETSSSYCFQNTDWLDFNMLQSGHGKGYLPNYKMITADYNKSPVKPCLDGEPNYEDHPINWGDGINGWFDDADVRRSAYWSVFSGSYGHTYGCHPIWQFLDKGREPIGGARHTWREVLDLPGAWDMIHLRNLIESRPSINRFPDPSIILSDDGSSFNRIVACRADNYIFIYLPANFSTTVRIDRISGAKKIAWWYNPRTGEAKQIGEYDKGQVSFDVPVSGVDWVLVIDDASAGFTAPGTK